MTISMDTTKPLTLNELERLLATTDAFAFTATDRFATYAWLNETLFRLRYRRLTKPKKGLVQRYLRKVTGYSKQQTKRLIGRWLTIGRLTAVPYRRHCFPTTYTSEDVALLAKTDQTHQVLSGPATKIILAREFERFDKVEYERLSRISPSHIGIRCSRFLNLYLVMASLSLRFIRISDIFYFKSK